MTSIAKPSKASAVLNSSGPTVSHEASLADVYLEHWQQFGRVDLGPSILPDVLMAVTDSIDRPWIETISTRRRAHKCS